jgi:hypothetical protein
VLYSAAGNSADEHWYNRGVIAYSFETGADRFGAIALTQPAAAGATAVRVQNRTFFEAGDRIVIGGEERIVAAVSEDNPPNPAPNLTVTVPLARAHPAGDSVLGDTTQVGVGFQPDYATEGKFEALEFAAGNYGLLESAYAYERDRQPPRVRMTGPRRGRGEITTTFVFVNEPAVIHYTTDGSRPTEQSPVWDATGPREPGEVFHLTESTTFRWRAEDIKGNVSYGLRRFVIRSPNG